MTAPRDESPDPSARATIHDVARALGVSARTVSRVYNGQAGVSAKTRARVQAYIREAGYEPHSGARSLRTTGIDCIGVTLASLPEVVPLSQDLLSWLFGELYRLFGERGEFICFDLHTNPVDGHRDYARGLWQQRFGAMVIAGACAVDDTVLARVHASGKPYLALLRLDSLPEANTATVDYAEGSYLATRFLLERGHTRIGFLQALAGYQPGAERWQGYARAHEEAGVPLDPALFRPTSFRAAELTAVTRSLLGDASVTGLVDASGALDAVSVREGARRAGRRLGDDVELVAWTYTYQATIFREAAAHVWLPVREASAQGLARFAEWVHGDRRSPVQILYRPQLVLPPYGGELATPRPVFSVD
jgi:LacI family transcriptional regulator